MADRGKDRQPGRHSVTPTPSLAAPPASAHPVTADNRGQPDLNDGQTHPGMDKLPLYVPRDLDTDLRTKVSVAGQRAGVVLLKEQTRDGYSH
jgi:hypothetical protein